jgi:hypothetical protein
MKKMILFTGLVAAYAASAQFLQNLTQALTQPEPAPAAQPVQVVQPAVQQVTTTTVQPVQQVTTTTVQPVQQVTTTTVVPATTVVTPPPVVMAPPGYQPCPRCGGRGKEEHALGFKVKRCKLCDGKGYLPPPPPPRPVHHHYHHRH